MINNLSQTVKTRRLLQLGANLYKGCYSMIASFLEEQDKASVCIDLLKAMELEDESFMEGNEELEREDQVMVEEWTKEDDEVMNLPEEWIYDLQMQKENKGAGEGSSTGSGLLLSQTKPTKDNQGLVRSDEKEEKTVVDLPQTFQPTAEDLEKMGQ